MITKPMPPEEALRYLVDKTSLPGDWDAKMWAAQTPDFRNLAFYSANVENARFLDRLHTMLFDYMAGVTEQVTGPDGVERTALRVNGRADFIRQAREFMIAEGMAKPGDFKDLNQKDVTDIRTQRRLELIFGTTTRQAFGYGQWKQGMQPAVLKAFPAARLVRVRGVKVPRLRHQVNLGQVKLKTDTWWQDYINDREIGGFGVPWGPYGYGSGCDQEDVSAAEAKRLGLDPDKAGEVPDAKITDGAQAGTKTLDPSIKEKLLEKLRAGEKITDPKAAARGAVRKSLEGRKADALRSGQTDLAKRIQDRLEALPSEGSRIQDNGDSITIAK